MAGVKIGTTTIAEYQYLGVGQVVRTELAEADHVYRAFSGGSTPSDYDHLDRFGRVVQSAWEPTGAGANPYAVELAYDSNSNITRVTDRVHSLGQHPLQCPTLSVADDNLHRSVMYISLNIISHEVLINQTKLKYNSFLITLIDIRMRAA